MALFGPPTAIGMVEAEDWSIDLREHEVTGVSSLTVTPALQRSTSAATSLRSGLSTASIKLESLYPLVRFGPIASVRTVDYALPVGYEGANISTSVFGAPTSDYAIVTMPFRYKEMTSQDPDIIFFAASHGSDNARAIKMLDAWLTEDAGSTDDSLERLKSELDRDRESSRRLFP